ncbi:MAG: sigma-70 family RNA polymerase sigma factor [Pseudomonadota bacterium]
MTDIPVGRETWSDLKEQIARRTRNSRDAEDLLHSAYLRLHRYRAENEVKDPVAFLIQAARNLAIDRYRRDQYLSESSDRLEIEDHAPLQDEVIAARARLERVKQGLQHLTPRTREVFLMHRLQNLKYHQIATQLGISTSAVEKHISKALLFLTEWAEGW